MNMKHTIIIDECVDRELIDADDSARVIDFVPAEYMTLECDDELDAIAMFVNNRTTEFSDDAAFDENIAAFVRLNNRPLTDDETSRLYDRLFS
jgi:hypothetical protein